MEPWFICTQALNISARYELLVFVMALINSQSEKEEATEKADEFTFLDSDEDDEIVEYELLGKG